VKITTHRVTTLVEVQSVLMVSNSVFHQHCSLTGFDLLLNLKGDFS